MRNTVGQDGTDDALEKVERLEKVAADTGLTILELAMSWLASRPVVSSVIAGATRPQQVKSNAASTHSDLPAEVYTAVDEALAAG